MRIVAVCVLALVSCAVDDAECQSDEDCVPASCCAARDAVPRDLAPTCPMFCNADVELCTTSDSSVFPVCRFGGCTLEREPWCGLDDLAQ